MDTEISALEKKLQKLETENVNLKIIARSQGETIAQYEKKLNQIQKLSAPVDEVTSKFLDEGIRDLNLSTMTINTLLFNGVDNVRELVQKTRRQLLLFRRMGIGSVNEIEKLLKEYGLKLKG